MSRNIKKCERGFTLLEAVIVVGLIAVVVAVTIPPFYKIIQKYRAQTAAEQVAMNLRFARLAAVKKRIRFRVVFNATPTNTYQMQSNPTRGSGTWEDYKYADTSIPDSLKILSGGISNVVFTPRGSANLNGGNTIRIQSTEFTYRINVYATGAVTITAE